MPTTTKMGIVYPASTDLVKNGATAMGTISTTVDNKTGSILLNTTSFSGVSSQSINDVFNTNFNAYKIVFNVSSFTTAATTLNLRMRVSGADNTDAQNYAAGTNPIYTTTTYSAYNSNAATTWRLATNPAGSTAAMDGFIDLYLPFLTVLTKIDSMTITSSDATVVRIGGIHNVSSSFTGFTIYPTAGNITGSLSVYGINK